MRKLYSLLAALMVAVFALAQTTPTVTIEIVGGNAIVTPTPSDAQVFFAVDATDSYEFSDSYTAESFVNEVLGFYNTEEEFDAVCPQGAKTHCLAEWGIEAGENTLVAAVVTWDATEGKAKCLSEVVRVDKTFAEDPVCDEGGNEGGEGGTPTESVTIEIVGGKVVFTPSSEEARYFFAVSATDDYGFSATYTPTNFVDESLEEYTAEYLDYLPVGSYEACLEDYIYEENVEITILAAEVEWDATSESLKRVSDISTLVKTIAEVPACEGGEGGEEGGEDDPIMTIEPGKYYVSTFMDETTQYLLTTTTGAATVLPATLYADANTPTAANEFEFVAVDGQAACFTIRDSANAFLAMKQSRLGNSTQFTLEASKPEIGAVWKVTLQDALNHVTIENTDFPGDIHCLNLEGEIAYCFGTEATGTYNLPILIKVPGTSTNLQEADSNRQVIKTIENGQLILNIDGVRYNILGIAL